MTWSELEISQPPPSGTYEFDQWMAQIVEHLRNYLGSFHRRGDPSSYDWAIGNLTADGTWKTGADALDCSSIIDDPEVKAVLLYVRIQDSGSTNLTARFREAGNSNSIVRGHLRTVVTSLYTDGDIIVPYNSNEKIEYYLDTGLDECDVVIKGWWK